MNNKVHALDDDDLAGFPLMLCFVSENSRAVTHPGKLNQK